MLKGFNYKDAHERLTIESHARERELTAYLAILVWRAGGSIEIQNTELGTVDPTHEILRVEEKLHTKIFVDRCTRLTPPHVIESEDDDES